MQAAVVIAACMTLSCRGQQETAREPAFPALTDQECAEWGERVAASVSAGDPNLINGYIDMDAVLARAFKGLEVPRKFADGVKTGVERATPIGTQICSAAKEGGQYKLLRIHRRNGEPHALFRLLLGSGGVNYHDMVLERAPLGGIKIVDVYLFATGEVWSDTFRMAVSRVLATQDKGLFKKLMGERSEFVDALPELDVMAQLAAQGRAAEALERYAKLPPSVKKEKIFMVVRVAAAQRAGEDEYRKAVEDFQKWFADDPASDLMGIDAMAYQKRFEDVLKAVDRLDNHVGGDPYLEIFRANAHVELGQPDLAVAATERAMANEPSLEAAYWARTDLALQARDYATVLRMLNLLEHKLNVSTGDLESIPAYADFVSSPEYGQWKRARE